MTFYTFMVKNHLNDDSPSGDLARDMQSDARAFPRNGKGKFDGWHSLIRGHLESRGACAKCLSTFEACWKEYVECEKKR